MPQRATTLKPLNQPKRVYKPKKYDKRAWRDGLRVMKLKRNPFCEDCLEKGLYMRATQVDHIDGDHNNDKWNNLRSLDASCHSRKTVKQDHGFGRPGHAKSSVS